MLKKIKDKLTKRDIAILAIFIVFLILISIPAYRDKHGCEVARPGYECASAKEVLIENCEYWAKYNCNTSADISLPQIVWYIKNLCKIANEYHNYGYDCTNPEKVCNSVLERNACR